MNFLKLIFVLSLFAGACNNTPKTEDNSNYKKNIKLQAEKMCQLLLKKDFSSFTKFTYPKVVEMMGGEAKMVEVIENGTLQMESEETSILNATIGEPSNTITYESEIQCTVPQTTEIKVPDGMLITKSTLIAISMDNGKNWYFVDTSGKDIQTMREMLPNLSPELVIPKLEEPTLVKD
jgi:hypothetical protein